MVSLCAPSSWIPNHRVLSFTPVRPLNRRIRTVRLTPHLSSHFHHPVLSSICYRQLFSQLQSTRHLVRCLTASLSPFDSNYVRTFNQFATLIPFNERLSRSALAQRPEFGGTLCRLPQLVLLDCISQDYYHQFRATNVRLFRLHKDSLLRRLLSCDFENV